MGAIPLRIWHEAACVGCGEPAVDGLLRSPMTRLDPEPGDSKLTSRFMTGRVPCEECGSAYAFLVYRCSVAQETECVSAAVTG